MNILILGSGGREHTTSMEIETKCQDLKIYL